MNDTLVKTGVSDAKDAESRGAERITLVFTLYDEDYGLDVTCVREIVLLLMLLNHVPLGMDQVKIVLFYSPMLRCNQPSEQLCLH